MKKKILLIVIPIILVLAIAGTVAALYLTTDIFQSAETLFWKNFASTTQVLDLAYNNNTNTQNEFKATNNYTSQGTLAISSQTGEQAPQAINIVTSGHHDKNTGRTYNEAILKNGETDLLKASFINSGDVYAIKCDEVLPNYLGIRNSGLKEVGKILGLQEGLANMLPDSIDFSSITNIFALTNEEKQHILETYPAIVTQIVGSDKYIKEGKEDITIDGTNYSANKYTLALNGDEVKQILVNMLAKLKEDSTTLVSISNKLAILGMNEDYTDITNLAVRLDEISMNIQNITIPNTLTLSTYVYQGQAVRNIIDISNVGLITIDIANSENEQKAIINIEQYTLEQASEALVAPNMATDANVISNEAPEGNVMTNSNVISNTISNATPNENVTSEDITNNMDEINVTVAGVEQQTGTETDIEQQIAGSKTAQITLSKTTNQNAITNTIEIIPDTSNMELTINYIATVGNVQNNVITNSNVISIINTTETASNVIDITYDTTITAAEQVNEIIELTNSNTVIVNNYKQQQIVPFLNAYAQKMMQIVTSKIQMIGVNTNPTNNQTIPGQQNSQ